MKTRTPAKNKKNLRRGRAIKRLEAQLMKDKATVPHKNPNKLALRMDELERTKKIQSTKGGSL